MRTNEELIAAYRAGESQALNELAKHNRGLIASVVRKWCKRRQYWDDTFQECSLAFLLAAHGFDLSRSHKFSTYATVAMKRHMRNLVIYREAQKRTANVRGMHDGIKCQSPSPLTKVQVRSDASEVMRRIKSRRTRKVVWLSMTGYTLVEIGKEIGVTFERVRQIRNAGLNEVKELHLVYD